MTEQIILDPYARNVRWKLREDARRAPSPWRWPLPRIGTSDPRIVGAHATDTYRAVDLGYGAASVENAAPVPVYAAQTGEIAAAVESTNGYAIVIDHGNRTWSTRYAHLAQLNVSPCAPRLRRRQSVGAGELIGYAARSPVHIRFELWQWTDKEVFVVVDPRPYLALWPITPPPQTKSIRFRAEGGAVAMTTDNLLDAIRASLDPAATSETRARGATARRAILAALYATAGEPMVTAALPAAAPRLPIADIVGALRGVPPDQLLDLAIAKLRGALPAGTDVPKVEPLKFHIIPMPRRGSP